MAKFEATFPHLKAGESVLHADIGRAVRFQVPTDPTARRDFLRTRGTFAQHALYEIVGVQTNWQGDLCYRIAAEGDSFGRPVHPLELRFVS
jgi:hypothetical protein